MTITAIGGTYNSKEPFVTCGDIFEKAGNRATRSTFTRKPGRSPGA